ncbi:hypothetical protein E2K93_00840 [Thalassotalea sp. HSM 43]|uniref:S8 family serine peptidase n=1 Tax=Thalassotalea sp. HSM 43 TaxID=2552945 RepID=UPI001081B9D6|nr:S8 family serine peptidase [Thalassotalea sp. HSM 43]QBY03003.1 hypothetical protein E2K93_00840 [Thalassotalea sp. HSM 43]
MKFKLNKIAMALPLGMMTLGAIASQQYPDDIPTVQANIADKNAESKVHAQKQKARYFVLLEDEPVALYQGGVKGFRATNIAASNGVNANASGKLDLQSSASLVYRNYLSLKQNEVFAKVQSKLNRNVEMLDRYQVALNGLLVELEPHEVLSLRKMPGVLAVQKNELKQLMTDVGPQHVGAPTIWDNMEVAGSKGEGLVIGVMDTGVASYMKVGYTSRGDAAFDGVPHHPAFADIGGDGYDHTNPYGEGVYFGDCVEQSFWCNDKLVGIIAYENISFSHAWPSYDMRYLTGQDGHGHGTHVASTIAGNVVHDVQYPTVYPDMEQTYKHKYYNSEMKVSLSGVAPHANIMSYQTCGMYGCWDDAAVASIEHAIANNVDVLNYSVGGGASSPWFSADALAFLSAREAGIHTAVAAGNSGRLGEKTVGSPGNSPWVTTVAALSHSRDFTEEKVASFTGGETELGDLMGKGATSGVGHDAPLEVVYAATVEDPTRAETSGGLGHCGPNSLPSKWAAENVSGKVVVCRRGGVDADGEPLSRLSKGAEALRAGAAGMVFINSEEEFDNVANDLHVLPTVHLSKEDGDAVLAWLESGEGHAVSFTDSELEMNPEAGDITASFTSRGPDYFTGDYLIPDVGAPGVDIVAGGLGRRMHSRANPVYAQIDGEWRYMSGTSMATPHVAGMYLLMKAAQPDWTPAEAQSALMMTAFTDVKEDDDFDGEKNRADFHRTGAGSSRVDLAVKAGLVLNETRAGYEAANPYAEEYGMQDEIPGWHGQPHQMNMPSLSKGECLIDCDWTRTFTATATADYSVSFEYYNEGFELSADKMTFSAVEGEETVVKFMAMAGEGLRDEWVNARVVLTPSDASLPTLTLPVTINFIAGVVPEQIDIDVHRTNDSVNVEGIITSGTSDLQLEKSGIVKADVREFELMRDASNGVIFDWQDEDNQTIKTIPLNVQAGTKRLLVKIDETTSPDMDIFVGIDANLDGKLSHIEMDLIRYMSAGPDSNEVIDILDPIQDTYWILVHNWAEGPAPLEEHQMVCEEGQEAAEGMECADAPIMDNVTLTVNSILYDEDNMMVHVPSDAAPREEIDARVEWDQMMTEGDKYHGVFWLGTDAEVPRNIGSVRVNMTRGADDVKVKKASVSGDVITFAVHLAANNSGQDRQYDFAVDLADNIGVDLLLVDQIIEGVGQSQSANELAYKVESNQLSFDYVHPVGAPTTVFNVVLNASEVIGMQDATPVLHSMVDSASQEQVDVVESEEGPVFIAGRPTAEVVNTVALIEEGEMVSVQANMVDAVIENPQISYRWMQISGPTAQITTADNVMSFEAPKVDELTTLEFAMVASNGEKDSQPVNFSVDVEEKPGDGGSTSMVMLLLGMLGLGRKLAKRK